MKALPLALLVFLFQAPPAPKATIEGTVSQAATGVPLAGVRVILARGTQVAAQPGAPAPPPPPQPPPSPPPPPSQPTAGAGIAGGAISFVQTVIPATPSANPANTANLPTATTDAQGHYVLKDLEAGSYRVTFAMNGYVKQDYGQRSFTGQGTSVVVTTGQSVKDINMSMTQAGNISGRLRDNTGMPAVGVNVNLLRANYTQTGQKGFQAVESSRSDDRGEFRLYFVSPGRYYLNAGSPPGPLNRPLGLSGGLASPNQVPGESFVYSYYPGVTNTEQAIAIDVQAGADVSGIDFPIAHQQLLNIRGRLIDSSTGLPPLNVGISLAYQELNGGGTFGAPNAYNPTTGAFEVTNIVPGSYTLLASLTNRTAPTTTGSSASVPIELFNRDAENVVVNMNSGSPLSGRISAAGAPPPSVTNMRVQLRQSAGGVPTMLGNLSTLGAPTANADGTFRLDSVPPGEYRINVPGLPADYYIKDIQLEQKDVLNKPLDFSGRETGTLEIVLGKGSVQIDGTVFDDKLRPAAGISVILIPDQRRDRADLYKAATTDTTGHYVFRGVSPGGYKLFAFDSIDANAWFDADLIGRIEDRGKTLRVQESANQTIDLKSGPDR